MQAAIQSGNVSETVYQAESLYTRYDVPYILPAVLSALRRRGVDTAAINTTHVLFTVRITACSAGIPMACWFSWFRFLY